VGHRDGTSLRRLPWPAGELQSADHVSSPGEDRSS
jgi:hypothetical protein